MAPRPVAPSTLTLLAGLACAALCNGLLACDGCGREQAPSTIAAPSSTGYALTGPRLTRAPRKTHPEVSDAATAALDASAP